MFYSRSFQSHTLHGSSYLSSLSSEVNYELASDEKKYPLQDERRKPRALRSTSKPAGIVQRATQSHQEASSGSTLAKYDRRWLHAEGSEHFDRSNFDDGPPFDGMSPSTAALYAINARSAISPKDLTTQCVIGPKMTFDTVIYDADMPEKLFSMALEKGPLDLLLSPAEDLPVGLLAIRDEGPDSNLFDRSLSTESMPSLDDASTLSDDSLPTPRGRRPTALRRSQSRPSINVTDTSDNHPLSTSDIDIDELDFSVFDPARRKASSKMLQPPVGTSQRKSAFKANLTASLRALKTAARSLSSLTSPMLMPDDFLTRSIVTIDPQVPFTDERRPQLEDDHPPAALRRYLNPTANGLDLSSTFARKIETTNCTASIQMKTYNVYRGIHLTDQRANSTSSQDPEQAVIEASNPVARQRDMRENGDFIRIAVMEMAMRRHGKLDSQRPGRAKWALPPRKPPMRPYEIGADGVPARWISQTH